MIDRVERLYGPRVHEHLADFPDDLLRRHARRLASRPPSAGALIREPVRSIDTACLLRYCLLNAMDRLLMIPVAAGEVDPEWPKEPLTPERNDELLQNMLAGVARAYRYFKEDRIAYAMADARPQPYERAGAKIGRNDPCPCGSGKKYKRCCGGAGARDDSVH